MNKTKQNCSTSALTANTLSFRISSVVKKSGTYNELDYPPSPTPCKLQLLRFSGFEAQLGTGIIASDPVSCSFTGESTIAHQVYFYTLSHRETYRYSIDSDPFLSYRLPS